METTIWRSNFTQHACICWAAQKQTCTLVRDNRMQIAIVDGQQFAYMFELIPTADVIIPINLNTSTTLRAPLLPACSLPTAFVKWMVTQWFALTGFACIVTSRCCAVAGDVSGILWSGHQQCPGHWVLQKRVQQKQGTVRNKIVSNSFRRRLHNSSASSGRLDVVWPKWVLWNWHCSNVLLPKPQLLGKLLFDHGRNSCVWGWWLSHFRILIVIVRSAQFCRITFPRQVLLMTTLNSEFSAH